MKKELEKKLIKYLGTFLHDKFGLLYKYSITNHDGILIYAVSKKDSEDKVQIIRVTISEDNQQIYIPTIFLPNDLQHTGLGKKLILIVYLIGAQFNYAVFVVDLVDSFRERLLKRGALTTNEYDTLEIVESTNLLD